jgi:hypothetical protein
MQKIRLLQVHGAVSLSLGVDQQGKIDASLFAEGASIVHVAKTDSGEVGSLGFELLLVCAQLRNVLAAEDSTVVPQKDDHCRPLCPERAKTPLFPVRIGQ